MMTKLKKNMTKFKKKLWQNLLIFFLNGDKTKKKIVDQTPKKIVTKLKNKFWPINFFFTKLKKKNVITVKKSVTKKIVIEKCDFIKKTNCDQTFFFTKLKKKCDKTYKKKCNQTKKKKNINKTKKKKL